MKKRGKKRNTTYLGTGMPKNHYVNVSSSPLFLLRTNLNVFFFIFIDLKERRVRTKKIMKKRREKTKPDVPWEPECRRTRKFFVTFFAPNISSLLTINDFFL